MRPGLSDRPDADVLDEEGFDAGQIEVMQLVTDHLRVEVAGLRGLDGAGAEAGAMQTT
jgi:hypothetical protein